MKFQINRMKICIVILVLLVIILAGYMVRETLHHGEAVPSYYNAYVISSENDQIRVYTGGEERTFEVKDFKEKLSGCLADLTVEGEFVTKVSAKKDKISGRILAVSDTAIEIEGYGFVEKAKHFAIYDELDQLRQGTQQDLTLGYQVADFFLEGNQICGAVVNRKAELSSIRVLINTTGFASRYHQNVTFSCEVPMTITWGNGGSTKEYDGGKKITLDPTSQNLQKGSITVSSTKADVPIVLDSVERSNGNPRYFGSLTFTLYDQGIVVVNELELESYLESVVSSEMPSSYGQRSLRVQALCARTYARKQIETGNEYASLGANLDDSTNSQVYGNAEITPQSQKAVKATAGKAIYYQDQLIDAVFYSTSCGVTTDASIWGGTGVPYLQSKALGDPITLDLTSNKDFLTFIRSDYKSLDSSYPYYRWSCTFSSQRILELAGKAGTNLGTLEQVEVTKRGPGGIVLAMTLTGTNGSLDLEGELKIRKFFDCTQIPVLRQDKKTETTWDMLPSAFFAVKGDKDGCTFYGGGYGHGLGLSQNGVKTLADKKMDIRDIVAYFYVGAVVR